MKTVLVAHLADTHLGHRQYGIYDRELDFYNAFQEAIERIIREFRVDLVVHSGDFFDTYRPPVQALKIAIRALKRLNEAGIPVVAILGDHDLPKRRGDHPLALLEDLGLVHVVGLKRGSTLQLYTRVKTKSGEVFVAGIPHHRKTNASNLRTLIASIRNAAEENRDVPRILMLHQGLQGYSPEYELTLDDLPRNFSYYALGHVHRGSSVKLGDAIAAYPGSLEVLRVDEVGKPHGFVVCEVDSRGTVDFIHVESRLRPQLVRTLSYDRLEDELNNLLQEITRIENGGVKPLVHLRIVGHRIDKNRVYKLLQSRLEKHVLFYRVSFEERGTANTEVPVEVEDGIDRLKLLEKLLGDKMLAEFADRLIDAVIEGAKDYEIFQLTQELFKRRYGG